LELKNVLLDNWMIFKGKQKIDFAVGKANITIIYGENMHGKTSLLNAIRWCLYGHAINRQGENIHPNDIVNSLAMGDGCKTCSVALEFVVDGSQYELWRELKLTDTGPVIDVRLKIDGRAIDSGKIGNMIDNILPEQISQFMLFDGELLRNFENLVVTQGSSQATGIKNAIEETLGFPMMRIAYEESVEVVKSMRREAKKKLSLDSRSKLVSDKLEELNFKLETAIVESEKNKTSQNKYKEELEILSDKLYDSQEALKLIEKKKTIKENLKELENKQFLVQENLKEITAELWLSVLGDVIAPIKDTYQKQLTQVSQKKSEQSSNYIEIMKLTKSLDKSECLTCGEKLPETKFQEMAAKLEELQDEIAQSIDYENLEFEIKTKFKSLDFLPNTNSGPEKYLARKDRDTELELDILENSNKIYDLEQKLNGVDEAASSATRNKYDAINKEVGALEQRGEIIDLEIERIENEMRLSRKSKDYEEISQSSDILKKSDLAEEIKDIFKNAIGLYRDRMRVDIEKRATETFAALTTERTFDSLQINENYGLNLIVDGKKVNRSAGAEQIVAMSLIEALNYHGRRRGPMIMDTPVGRLDNKHRKNILKHLPTVVTQLSIFAHSGELAEDSDLINPNYVGKRFKIIRKGTFEAQVEAL
jgi:DNA sulfur modification protein DndD